MTSFSSKIQEKMEEKREAKEIYTLLFTAGTALLMACLKRAIMLILIEQWRLWVFLVLNLVLLAIFFTSMHSISSDHQALQSQNHVKSKKECGGCENNIQERSNNVKVIKIERMRRHKQCVKSRNVQVEAEKKHKKFNGEGTKENEQEDLALDDDCEEAPRLSKEELNERVEAFIATFRQHLVLDARKGRD